MQRSLDREEEDIQGELERLLNEMGEMREESREEGSKE